MTIAPFSCTYSPQLPELLQMLNCSIALTTYQAGKLILISPLDDNRFSILPRSFDKPMGFDIQGNRMVMACKNEVMVFVNSVELAEHYPNKPNTYDSLWMPRITFHTGMVDLHDISIGKDVIWAINTSFSCLCQINGSYSFTPVWKPPFITDLVSEDRCHLNGMVMVDGVPKYVTMLGTTDTYQGWRGQITNGGILMDVVNNEIILRNLPMPHSPMIYKGDLYMLLSASGEVIKVDVTKKRYEVIKQMDGFCRGMDIFGDYMFIGMSKLRQNSSTFAKLPFAGRADAAGIKIVHLPTRAYIGEIVFQTSVDEIYGVKVLPGSIRPNVLNTVNPVYKYALAIPDNTFWANSNPDNDDHN